MDYLAYAFKLAKKANPSPNPRVGCVIVKGEKIIGQGYHKKPGEPHAEALAMASVSDPALLQGSTLYVTLEPCSHEEKRTPPCVPVLIAAGIAKVVIGVLDENPSVRGMEELKAAGIGVELVNDPQCRELNEAFFHWVKTGLPFVMLKLAMTLDGRIATRTGHSQYISNPQSRSIGYAWRAQYDAILVGINTVLIDNPRLTARTPGAPNPVRIVLDSRLRIPLTSRVLEPTARRIIVTTARHDPEKKKQLESLGVEVLVLPEETPDHIDLQALLATLGKQSITSILVEGGSEIATDFLERKLLQKGAFFIAAKILGSGKSAFEGRGAEKMDDAWQLKNISIRKVGNDVLVMGYF